jgi:hypothetical protein
VKISGRHVRIDTRLQGAEGLPQQLRFSEVPEPIGFKTAFDAENLEFFGGEFHARHPTAMFWTIALDRNNRVKLVHLLRVTIAFQTCSASFLPVSHGVALPHPQAMR